MTLKTFRKTPIANVLLACSPGLIQQQLSEAVDDAPDLRGLTVSTGLEAVNHLLSGQFHLVLLTPTLSDADGWQIANMVRSGSFCRDDLPVVMACYEDRLKAARPLAQEYDVEIVSLNDMPGLADCIRRVRQRTEQRNPSLLIIEDDPNAAHFAASCLEYQFTIDIAHDGAAGLAAWDVNRHDLVLLDVQLPSLSGYDVHQEMMRLAPSQPVVVITAFGNKTYHRDFVLSGATAFVHKPIDASRLREVCTQALRRGRLSEQYQQAENIEEQLYHITVQVEVASRYLESGRTAAAAYHLRHALAINSRSRLSEDEWVALLDNF